MSDTPARAGHAPLPPELDPRGPRRPTPRPAPRRRRLVAGVAASMALVVVAFSVLGSLVLGHYDGKISRVSVFAGLTNRPAKANTTAQNILLVGSDNREGLTPAELYQLNVGAATSSNGSGRRTDTMILLHVSADRGRVTMLSLPRDSYVTIPAYTDAQGKHHPQSRNKLNAAYSLGGPPLMVATVEANTGVHIDHYVEIGFEGFVKMVNAVGGVPVCTPKPLKDHMSGLDIPAGTTQMDGATALRYVRARYVDPRADLGRIDRQQAFLGALFRKATSSQVLLNPLKLNRFLDAVLGSVTTDADLTHDDILALASQMRSVAAGNVVFATIPLSDANYAVSGVGSTVLWDHAKAELLFKAFRDDTPVNRPAASAQPSAATIPPSSISVLVLNGAGVAGLAARAAGDLQQRGFVLAGPAANASTTGASRTVVRYDPNWSDSLRTVLAALPGATAEAVPGQGKVFQVVVGSSYAGAKTVTVVPAPSAGSSGEPVKTTSAATNNPCANR